MGSRQPGPVGSPRTGRVPAIPGPGTRILYGEFATQPDPRYTQNIQRRWPPRTRSDPHPSSTCREDTCESGGHTQTHTPVTHLSLHTTAHKHFWGHMGFSAALYPGNHCSLPLRPHLQMSRYRGDCAWRLAPIPLDYDYAAAHTARLLRLASSNPLIASVPAPPRPASEAGPAPPSPIPGTRWPALPSRNLSPRL